MQEQLDGAGIELPTLYKLIENQAAEGCHTEAWRRRAHWVGSQVTSELTQSVKDAEDYLQSCRPVRRYSFYCVGNNLYYFLLGLLVVLIILENMENFWRKVLVDF